MRYQACERGSGILTQDGFIGIASVDDTEASFAACTR
jgi:hypothetical protein